MVLVISPHCMNKGREPLRLKHLAAVADSFNLRQVGDGLQMRYLFHHVRNSRLHNLIVTNLGHWSQLENCSFQWHQLLVNFLGKQLSFMSYLWNKTTYFY